MKKILTVLFFMMSLVLVSCGKDIHKKVFDSLEVTYSENESKDGVKSNFTLPVVNEDLGATIEYESKNLEVVTIVNGVATVNRSTEDVNVTILVTVKIKNDVKTFDLVVKVLKKEAVVTEKYTVNYIVDGNVYLEEEYDKDTLLVLAKAPIKANHTFKAWLLNDNLVDPDYKITKNIELVAKFEKDVVANKYTVTYIVDGDVYLEEEYEENALLVLADAPTKENYSFKAWLLNDSLVDPGYKVTKSIELVAKFEEKQPVVKYNVTFVVDSKVYFEKEIEKDAKIEFPKAPTKENYEFKGWLLGKEIIGANYIVTKEIELVAMFEINQSVGTSFTETFDNLKSGSSSYSDGSFTGVNDIEWNYTDGRTDDTLNGRALMIRKGVLKTTFKNGLNYLKFDYKTAFTDKDGIITIKINGVLLDTVIIESNLKGTYENKNLNHEGDVILEISQTVSKKRILFDDLTWKEYSKDTEGPGDGDGEPGIGDEVTVQLTDYFNEGGAITDGDKITAESLGLDANVFKVIFTNNSSGNGLYYGSPLRIYAGTILEIKILEGYKITKLKFVTPSTNNEGVINISGEDINFKNSYENGQLNINDFKLKPSKQLRLTLAEITYIKI